jgi:Cytochrome C'
MTMHVRLLSVGIGILVLGFWSLATVRVTAAADEGGIKGAVQQVADALEKGNEADAKKHAEEIAKGHDLEDVMNLMSLRRPNVKKPVFGFESASTPKNQDGIEAKVTALSKKVDPQKVSGESEALFQMAYRIKAISQVAQAKVPEKDEGAKKRKDWIEWAGDMQKSAQDLADAAKSKDAEAVHKAAKKLNSTCNNCHGTFRD